MEPTKEKLIADLALLEKALATLDEALQMKPTSFVRDATIQRFEYSFELSWKSIQVAARFNGVTCNSPREAIKIAYKEAWLDNYEAWFHMLEVRNSTSHIYNAEMAEGVYNQIRNFPPAFRDLLSKLKVFSVQPEKP